MKLKTPVKLALAVGAGIVIGVVAILANSFPGVDYFEMGFPLSRTTGGVNVEKVYSSGRYGLGPDKTFKTFLKSVHFETFANVGVFTSDRLEIIISASFQYYLRPHQLVALHDRFDIHYRPILKSNAQDALKNAAIFYNTREYIRSRETVENAFAVAIKERLSGKCCEKDCGLLNNDACEKNCKSYSTCTSEDWGLFARMSLFQLTRVIIPGEVSGRFLNSLLLIENNEEAKLKQQSAIIRKQTDQNVKDLNNEADVILQSSVANATLLRTLAEADAKFLVENSRMTGLKSLYTDLNISNDEHKAAFDYLRTLKRQHQLKLAVDFQSYIAGNLGKNK